MRPSNASINLEETCTFDSAQSKDELVRKYPVCVDISTQTKNDDQKLSNNNAGQFCMSENAYVNLLNKVAEVRNDTAHSISQTRINKNVNANSSKHLVACPFLLKKGHCLKGSRCDFSHNISQSRISKKASVIPPKEVLEVSNDVVYPTTLNDSSVSTNSSAPNEMYAIPVRITTRRRGKHNPQKFRRRNSEHFLWDSGNPNRPPESKPESQLENHNSWKAYLQSVNQTLDQLGTQV
ncbi:---NA--- [Paramuricea clavata]|uniref:---NA n=1 Tax=Paramuricea clavata TaxID=317549 RepID=A0A6S7HEZ7_PARCT|nr:---NA--- [Paramuricea clavata]